MYARRAWVCAGWVDAASPMLLSFKLGKPRNTVAGPSTPVNNFVTIRLLPDNKPGDTLLFSGGGYVAKVTPSIVG